MDHLYPIRTVMFETWVDEITRLRAECEAPVEEEEEENPDNPEDRVNPANPANDPVRERKLQLLNKFIVTGIREVHPDVYEQVSISTMGYALGNPSLPTLSRDYDSLLGFTVEITTRKQIYVFPAPRFT